MKHEVVDNDIVFTVKSDRLGKWVIIDALNQVIKFWRNVAFYKTFKRQPFESIIIKIDRDGSQFKEKE